MGRNREPMVRRHNDGADGPANGLGPQRPERFAERLKREVRKAVGEMRRLLTGGRPMALRLWSADAQREHLLACLGSASTAVRCHVGPTRSASWSVLCCPDPAFRGQFAGTYVKMSRAEWRLPGQVRVALLVGQCRRCGTIHWVEGAGRSDDDGPGEDD